jgi:hypothetical protein
MGTPPPPDLRHEARPRDPAAPRSRGTAARDRSVRDVAALRHRMSARHVRPDRRRRCTRSGRAATAILAAVAALALAAPPPAGARDPGRWLLTGASSVPVTYWQGLTSTPAESRMFFVGVFQGLWRATPQLRQTAGVPAAIPASVAAAEGYNHIGDPTWNRGGGGRLILPMECYTPGVGNTCDTGAFGVAEPASLDFRYYVKLDPAEIPKAMWAETSPGGRLIWTSSGDDLLAYRSRDVRFSNRGPRGPVIEAVRRLRGAVPPTGVTGAVFRRGRLLLAGAADHLYRVWSVDTRTGRRRLEVEMRICGESEGLDVIPTLGGRLHWLIAPFDPGCELTFGPTSALLHFAPRPGRDRFRVEVTGVEAGELPGEVQAKVRVRRRGQPVRDAEVSFAGGTARTGRRGAATVATALELPGRFGAVARRGKRFGASALVPIGLEQAARRTPIPRTGAR